MYHRRNLSLAVHRRNRYVADMLCDVAHRISAILVTLALVFGPAATGAYASSMGAEMAVAAASEMHSPGKCSDCGASKTTMSGGVCSVAFCSGFTAFPVAGGAVFDWVADSLRSYSTRDIAGRVIPPDPYPPRFTILN